MTEIYKPKTDPSSPKESPYGDRDDIFTPKSVISAKPSPYQAKPNLYTPKDVYDSKDSPYSPLDEIGFLLTEDGGFLLQENTGKIIISGILGGDPFDPYSGKVSPYSHKTA